jgi:hypothetical protein
MSLPAASRSRGEFFELSILFVALGLYIIGPESLTPPKAEYIGADQLPSFVFRLQLCGGPYIPIIRLSDRPFDIVPLACGPRQHVPR